MALIAIGAASAVALLWWAASRHPAPQPTASLAVRRQALAQRADEVRRTAIEALRGSDSEALKSALRALQDLNEDIIAFDREAMEQGQPRLDGPYPSMPVRRVETNDLYLMEREVRSRIEAAQPVR